MAAKATAGKKGGGLFARLRGLSKRKKRLLIGGAAVGGVLLLLLMRGRSSSSSGQAAGSDTAAGPQATFGNTPSSALTPIDSGGLGGDQGLIDSGLAGIGYTGPGADYSYGYGYGYDPYAYAYDYPTSGALAAAADQGGGSQGEVKVAAPRQPAAPAQSSPVVKPPPSAAPGLQWGGRTFTSWAGFASWLTARGGTLSDFVRRHPAAATELSRSDPGGLIGVTQKIRQQQVRTTAPATPSRPAPQERPPPARPHKDPEHPKVTIVRTPEQAPTVKQALHQNVAAKAVQQLATPTRSFTPGRAGLVE